VINIVDSAERLAALAPVVEAMMDTGMTAISDVQMIRVQKRTAEA
jgi:PII-like signaling protein